MAKFLKNITLLLLIFASTVGISQQERGYIRKGNKMFNDSNYVAADSLYLKALQIDSTSIEAKYNLTNSLLKQGNTDEAIKNFNEILEETEDENILAKAHHNLGNAHANKQEWQKAVDSYKNALRNDPNDKDARYNYAYAKSKLAKEQDKKNDDKENKDKKDQKKKDKKDKGDKNKEDKKKKEGEGDKDKKDENSEKEKKKKEDEQKKKDKENKKKSDQEKGKEDEEKDKKEQNGEKNKPQTDEQKKEKQKKAKAKQIKKKQAEQILRQLDKNEKNIQQKLIRAKMKKQARKKIDKDW